MRDRNASSTAPWGASLGVLLMALICLAIPGLRRAWVATTQEFPASVPYPHVCTTTVGAACTQAVTRLLEQTTWEQTGAHLHWLPQANHWPERIQIFTALNLERLAFHRPPIAALTPALDRVAQAGAQHATDPEIPNTPAVSVWAQAPNGINALFLWLFDDGYASPNLACGSWDLSGCWSHRQNLLTVAAPGGTLISGIGIQNRGTTQSIAWIAEAVAHTPPHPVITWAAIRRLYPTPPITRGPRPLPWTTVVWIWVSRLGIVVAILAIALRAAWQSGVLGIWLPHVVAWWTE